MRRLYLHRAGADSAFLHIFCLFLFFGGQERFFVA